MPDSKSGGFKGIKRTKSDDQPHKAVRTGTGKFTGRAVPDKSRRVPRSQPGTPMGKCLLAVGKTGASCQCGGHFKGRTQ